MSNRLMCHVVAGYPDKETCLKLIQAMDEHGVAAIEIQVPFSDPIADGETIMRANDTALDGGMTTETSFNLISDARKLPIKCDVYVMSYLQKVQHFGLKAFCERAASGGAQGLIIPDMPYDSPEYANLKALAGKSKLRLIPVISPGMPKSRLGVILKDKPELVYVTSQRGITGNAYSATSELKEFIKSVRTQSDAKIMIGFGITKAEDVKDALKLGDLAIVGSAIIKSFQTAGLDKTLDYIKTLAGAAGEA